MKKEKVYEYIEVDDSTPIQKLSVTDQLRVLFKKLTYDTAQELKRDDAVTEEYLRLKASLIDFINKATQPIKNGEHTKVNISISSKYLPVYNEVIENTRYSNYYKITTIKPDSEYNIDYDFICVMEART